MKHGDDDFMAQNELLDKQAVHKFQERLETVNPSEADRIEKAKEISFFTQDKKAQGYIKRIVEQSIGAKNIPMDNETFKILCGITKIYVAELVEESRRVQVNFQ